MLGDLPDNSEQPDEGKVQRVYQQINGQLTGLQAKSGNHKKFLIRLGISIVALIVVAFVGCSVWYFQQLRPRASDLSVLTLVTVQPGMSPQQIGKLLQDKGIIRNQLVFDIYARLSGNRGNLQAGSYRLSSAESVQEVTNHLVSGKVDQFSITFLPGATLAQNREILIKAGFAKTDIDSALSAKYDYPIFESKPSNIDLEGLIYGETYQLGVGASVGDVLEYTFKQFDKVLVDNDFVSGFKNQGLSLYQAITLASIVQREAPANQSDQAQIAQVFYKRLRSGIQLGSDVTYQYIADKLGVARDINIDSPYNTRRYVGLPPGPIAVPGLGALKAVASPASGDYMYFLSGDDGKTYYANTFAEHEANIRDHCKLNCSQL
jgi:UPF0755 protein